MPKATKANQKDLRREARFAKQRKRNNKRSKKTMSDLPQMYAE